MMQEEERKNKAIIWILQGAIVPAFIVSLLFIMFCIYFMIDDSSLSIIDSTEKSIEFMKDIFIAIVIAGGLFLLSFFDEPKNRKRNFHFLGFLIFFIPFLIVMSS